MTVWRAKLNSGRGGPEFWDGAKEYSRRANVVGVGWGCPEINASEGSSLDEVLQAISEIPSWKRSGPQTVSRLANQVAVGDLVWTRDGAGWYWLGRVSGPWHFDVSDEATRWDLNNVRACEWLSDRFRDFQVPGAVVRSFVGTATTLRRVKGEPAARMTTMIYEQALSDAPVVPLTPEEVITDLLDPTDVEDLVLLLLQAEGWILLPSSRMRDTPVYEAAFRHRDDGRMAVVSVKSGTSNPVPIEKLKEAAAQAQAFAFSTHDLYTCPPEAAGVGRIDIPQLVKFMAERPEYLPPRIADWM